ncbi:unnamed protein product [Durusdinium trenchii]|uniref:Uncharacterized protein n=1 Tax=Durusdinium trenchii TaxID=1381693 RepID=A0ABP0Q9Q8_9DINO
MVTAYAYKLERGATVLRSEVLLLLWQENLTFDGSSGSFDFLELFSGKGEVTKLWRDHGFRCCSVDLDYADCMDFEKHSTFALCLWAILNEVPDAFNVLAPVCGSWSTVSRGSTLRNYVNPMGHQPYNSVAFGNRMTSKCVLLILVMLACNCIFALEQPSQSLMPRHKRLEWLLNRVAYVYEVHFWAMHYGKECPKRTMMLSNLRTISTLDRGVLSNAEKVAKHKVETTRIAVHTSIYNHLVLDPVAPVPRSYTRAFGERLLELYQHGRTETRYDLRTRPKIPKGKSDKELFEELQLGDIWYESKCHETFLYLFESKHLRTEWNALLG